MSSWIAVGAISGFLSVLLGAFGAHTLQNQLTEKAITIYQTGNHYHIVHALALLGLGILCSAVPQMKAHFWIQLTGYSFLIGTFLFSGSLYLLAVSGIRALGIITPFGGLSFLLGWFAFAMIYFKSR